MSDYDVVREYILEGEGDYRGVLAALDRMRDGQRGPSEALCEYLSHQWEWSKRTFGPGKRTGGIIQHIRKELLEIESEPLDLYEWCDVVILAMDGFWRHGGKPEGLMPALLEKQRKNFARNWPTPTSEDVAVEHDRSTDEECTREHWVRKVQDGQRGHGSGPSAEASARAELDAERANRYADTDQLLEVRQRGKAGNPA